MKRTTTLTLAAAAAVLCLILGAFSCARKEARALGFAEREEAPPPAAMKSLAKSELRAANAADGLAASADRPAEPSLAVNADRKIIKTGSVSLEVQDLAKTESGLTALAQGMGGYVVSSSRSERDLSVTLKVPSAKFTEALKGSAAQGRLLSREESAEDVTASYVDQESRLASKKILRDRYLDYLKRAENTKDLLATEAALNDVIADIESRQAQFNALKDSVEYSSIYVSARLPAERQPETSRSFLSDLYNLWKAFLSFLYWLAFAVIGLVLFGIPLVAALIGLYILLFGKIGWARKLFKRLKKTE
jgi:hypothetical protein